MSDTFASLFSGFGGADIGAKAAGLQHLWGVEYDPAIAAVAALNGFPSMVADVREVDYGALETPYWLHMSPVCKRASTANVNAGEAQEDIETAQACVRAIVALRPPFVSLENVQAYEGFEAFRLICKCLADEGYAVDWWILNAADYGVPQTRKRLMLVASRISTPRRPFPTHAKKPDMFTQKWIGWYEAIADLLPGLPDAELAEWQKKFLPDELKTMLLDGQANMYGSSVTMRDKDDPAFTMTASLIKHLPKAIVFQPNESTWEHSNYPRGGDEPIYTVKASIGGKTALPKALLIESQQHNRPPSFREQDEPSVVVAGATSPSRWRAVMVEMTNTTRAPTVLDEEQPSMTVIAGHGRRPSHLPLAVLSCRIVKLTPRPLARFQGFPDWFVLPDKVKLACQGIGNAVAPPVQQVLMETQLNALKVAA